MKKVLAILVTLSMMFSMAACGGDSDGGAGVVDKVTKMLGSQGRSYDELVTGEQGDKLSSEFFDFTITNAESAAELDGYTPNVEGNQFIVADVAVTNTTDEDIPVGNYDFSIIWDTTAETAEEDHYAYTVFMDGMYPDDEYLTPGDTLSGKLVFELPADVKEFGIAYEEIYDDDFVGDTYVVQCSLK